MKVYEVLSNQRRFYSMMIFLNHVFNSTAVLHRSYGLFKSGIDNPRDKTASLQVLFKSLHHKSDKDIC